MIFIVCDNDFEYVTSNILFDIQHFHQKKSKSNFKTIFQKCIQNTRVITSNCKFDFA